MSKFENVAYSPESTFDEVNDQVAVLLEIDMTALDVAAVENVKIFSCLQKLYNIHTKKLHRMTVQFKKVEMQRWKHYCGKMPPDHYKQEPLREAILKQDIDRYMAVDDTYQSAKSLLDEQDRIVSLIEKSKQEVKSRGFNIKNAIDYQRMINGM